MELKEASNGRVPPCHKCLKIDRSEARCNSEIIHEVLHGLYLLSDEWVSEVIERYLLEVCLECFTFHVTILKKNCSIFKNCGVKLEMQADGVDSRLGMAETLWRIGPSHGELLGI